MPRKLKKKKRNSYAITLEAPLNLKIYHPKNSPMLVSVMVEGLPIYRKFEDPVAIAVRYTNINDKNREKLEISFIFKLVDNWTAANLVMPKEHPVTGHQAVCIYGWISAQEMQAFREGILNDLGNDTVWIDE